LWKRPGVECKKKAKLPLSEGERGRERKRESMQENIFGGQLLGGGIKCLWNEVPHASKASSIGKWTGGLTQIEIVFKY
jgi:hypothetical protein